MPFGRLSRLAALSVALCCTSLTGGAMAQTTELKLSHFLPPNHTFHKWALAWGEQLAKESNGRVKVTVYPNGQLVGPPNRQFDAARNGIVDIAFTLHGVTPGRYPTVELTNLAFTWPKGGPSSALAGKRMTELAPTYLAREHEGLHILWLTVAMPVVTFSKQPIRKLDDYKGVKIRYSGAQNRDLFSTIGAVPLLVSPMESTDGLAKGIIDAATLPHEGALSIDLGSVAKHATEPGMSTAPFGFVMNTAKYNSLPPDLKALIDKTSGPAAAEHYGKLWDEAERQGRNEMIKQAVQIHTLSDADVAEIKRRMAPRIEEAVAAVDKAGKPGRKFYEEYTK
jgi:TRAP-type C4-dicarboxylate transport system substrate-binding protein